MSDITEFETSPVTPDKLQPARYFAASFAGEHVAGTEFVIGAMFVTWGVSTADIFWGLLWGNLLAVLTWTFVCAPIAVDTRLTLYAYLKRIAGPGTIRIYSVVNGILFCILAGTMITVSASAVRILFDIPAQVHWYPTDGRFVLVALAVGAVVVAIAIKGFRRVAQFAEVCAPWMILMFIAGALSMYPLLQAAAGGDAGFGEVADRFIWRGDKSELSAWHVAAFAWVCNLAMHGGLSDMTVLRYARRYEYGYFSAFGMFIGHYLAWVCAGIMGAGAALVLGKSITELDAGGVAYEALGSAGILAVIIAGWTTSNPTIYRAGLAFQSLRPSWNREVVTAVVGAVTTVIACFPFVFSRLMDFVGMMGLILVPVGAVIVAEHWLFPRLGYTRYWSQYRGQSTNLPAVLSWGIALLVAFGLNRAGVHLFFLLVPVWITATLAYLVLAGAMGARQAYPQASGDAQAEAERQAAEQACLAQARELGAAGRHRPGPLRRLSRGLALLALIACIGMALWALGGGDLQLFRRWLWLPTLVYFAAAILWVVRSESGDKAAA
ncbi:hypothetical protein [Haliea sp. E17]|uniref:hypothetical protein n=1 Tax=Haliea sp. E17 TaxID=3401576 RepID=UPI003AAFE441